MLLTCEDKLNSDEFFELDCRGIHHRRHHICVIVQCSFTLCAEQKHLKKWNYLIKSTLIIKITCNPT